MSTNLLSRVREEVDLETRAWPTYGPKHFNDFARPVDMFKLFVAQQFYGAQAIARSASMSSQAANYNLQHDTGELRRGNSYCSMSPVNGMSSTYRRAPRLISSMHSYVPKTSQWRTANRASREKSEFNHSMVNHAKSHQLELSASRPSVRHTASPMMYPRKTCIRPVGMSRLDYDRTFQEGRLAGLALGRTWLTDKYDLTDVYDRRAHKLHWGSRSTASRYGGLYYRSRPDVLQYTQRSLMLY